MAKNPYAWYERRAKPAWSPPRRAFPLVWGILYPVIVIVNIIVIIMLARGDFGVFVALPFWLNLIFNLAFTPLAPLKRVWLAAVDALLVWLTVAWSMAAIVSYNPWLAILFIPYFLWSLFATVLQINIAKLNT